MKEINYLSKDDFFEVKLGSMLASYDRDILTIEDVRIQKNAWIGAGATILPGVTIGENAIVGAGSVVTRDVLPNTVVAGNPARVIQTLDPDRFEKE